MIYRDKHIEGYADKYSWKDIVLRLCISAF